MSLSCLLLLRLTVRRVAAVIVTEMGSQVGVARELLVAASARVDGASRVVRHVNAQLVKVQERLVALRARVLLLLVLLRHVQPAYTPHTLILQAICWCGVNPNIRLDHKASLRLGLSN